MYHHLRSWALLLFLVQSQQRDVGYLDDLETDTGNITDGVTLTTETGNQNLVVLLNVVQATVTGYESGNLLAVLDELNPHALADGRVRLFGLNTTAKKRERCQLVVVVIKGEIVECFSCCCCYSFNNSQYNPVI